MESSYQLLINGREKVGFKKLRNTKAFTDYSQTTDDVYENLEDYNQTKKRKVFIVFDDINKKWSPILTGSFVRGRKLSKLIFFYITILFESPSIYSNKRNTLLYHQNA